MEEEGGGVGIGGYCSEEKHTSWGEVWAGREMRSGGRL